MSTRTSPPPEIPATVRLCAETGTIFVCAYPAHIPALDARSDYEEDHGIDTWHNCDEMGCGSAGQHIIARVRLWEPTP